MIELPVLLEGAVAVLLAITVGYCIVLERRMRIFNAGRESLELLVAGLDSATTRAERAVVGLSQTTGEAQVALEQRIEEARMLTRSLALMASGAPVRAAPGRRGGAKVHAAKSPVQKAPAAKAREGRAVR